ncbi:MAG TPA: NAD(P)H-quinone oxidoreductase [Pyrinomonadaceae bacterium]|nr:NAD(P)H-quinone oxidoreductase [Pyrinomonadaceae bacterium]
MRAVRIGEFNGVDDVAVRDIDAPRPGRDEALVRVRAAGVNRADLLQAAGRYPPPIGYSPNLPGLEFAGEIVELGEGAPGFALGDRVFGIAAGHAQAELLVSHTSLLAAIPENLSYTEAGGIPEVYITAHDAVFTQNELKKGETLLIHAVASGVGLAALDLAAAAGARVIGTSRTAEKIERLSELGLENGIVTADGKFSEEVLALTEGHGADVILDLVGAGYFAENIASLAQKGRLSVVGLTSGTKAEIDLGVILRKRASIRGTALRARSLEEKAAATENFIREVVPLLDSGAAKPHLDRVFMLEDVREAFRFLASNKSIGKIVLEI